MDAILALGDVSLGFLQILEYQHAIHLPPPTRRGAASRSSRDSTIILYVAITCSVTSAASRKESCAIRLLSATSWRVSRTNISEAGSVECLSFSRAILHRQASAFSCAESFSLVLLNADRAASFQKL